ncbi:sodium/proline symporter [Arthrobacter castelli]|uniref:sodium/proline symporter n=1 Tax=Arthrobacter castelli TaxID=271431 RepID=UPI00041D9070|nr:sodium/proline symporter [Arthrobacter castelli]
MPSTADPSTIIVFLVYLLAVLAIGIWAYRKNTGMSDFAIGGRRLGTFVTAVSAKATDSSQWVFFGLPGAFYVSGMSNIWLILGLTIGFYLSWRILAGRLREYSAKFSDWRQKDGSGESVTLPGFFANRFHSNSLRSVSAIFIIIFYVIYLGSAFIATGVIFAEIFGTSVTTGTIVGAVVVMLYSSLGGYLASSYTDVVQGFIMFFSLLILSVIAIFQVGGIGGFINAIGAQNPDLGSPFVGVELVDGSWVTTSSVSFVAIISGLAWAAGYFGSPHILARFMGMRKAESARNGARLGVFLSITLLGFAAIIGFAAIAIYGPNLADPEDAYISLVSDLMPTWAAGVFLAGVLSAVMSTADSQLVVASTTLTEDFYRSFMKRDAPEKLLVWLSRIAVLVCTGIGVVVALQGGSILDLVAYAWAGFGASFGPVLLAALYSRKTTWFGALASIVTGGVTVIVYRQIDMIGLYELVPAFLAGLLALWIGNRFGPGQKQEVVERFDAVTGKMTTLHATSK